MKRSFIAFSLAMAAGPLALLACGEEAPKAKDPTTVTVTPPASSSVAAPSVMPSASVTTPPPPPPPPPPVVSDVTPSAEETKNAPAVKFTAPAANASVGDAKKAADFVVKLDVKNWDFKDGKHVHLMLDGNPYKKIVDLKAPIKLGELLPAGAELKEGQHVLFAFPGRATHESVKAPGAVAVVTFWVGKAGKATIDTKKPMVIYSRPKGANVGDMGKNLMIDFSLLNTTLAKGEKVKFTITGGALKEPLAGEFVKWAPKLVNNLQKGDYELKLELLDKDGKAVEQPFPATGKFSVDADAPNDPAMGMAMGMGPAPAASSAAPAASSAAPATSGAKPAATTSAAPTTSAKKG